jgi:hypothetical protein
MRICKIDIKNFRGITEGSVILSRHCILLGANNAGKSSIAEALALLFGRERMIRPISDWDFNGGAPRPETRFHLIGTVTDFGKPDDNDPTNFPDWFIGENAARPVWWTEETGEVHYDPDPPTGSHLAAQIALSARFDNETCEFETSRYFYDGDCDPFTESCSLVPNRLLRDLGVFLLSSNREWDRLLAFGSSSLLKVLREYDAIPGEEIERLKGQLRDDVAKIEKADPLSEILGNAEKELVSFLLFEEASRLVYRPTSLDTLAVLQSLIAHVARGDGSLVPVSRQGSGTISLQAFLLLLAFAENRRSSGQNFILIAEEPELHLHPSLHQRLVHRIHAVSAQSIVTTHSPNVAAGYQPKDVIFVKNQGGQLSAKRLRTDPIKSIPKNSVRQLYLTHRTDFYEAIMGGVILVPEGQYDFEWLSLWQRLAQSVPGATSSFDLRATTILPTSDAAVADSFRELAQFRPDAVPVLDGDEDGDKYISDLIANTPAPGKVLRYGKGAAVECFSAWLLEPALCSSGTALTEVLAGTNSTLKNLQDALVRTKKEREIREGLVWECLDSPPCCERVCEVFHDLAAIASGGKPKNPGWTTTVQPNGTSVHTATHIQKASA